MDLRAATALHKHYLCALPLLLSMTLIGCKQSAPTSTVQDTGAGAGDTCIANVTPGMEEEGLIAALKPKPGDADYAAALEEENGSQFAQDDSDAGADANAADSSNPVANPNPNQELDAIAAADQPANSQTAGQDTTAFDPSSTAANGSSAPVETFDESQLFTGFGLTENFTLQVVIGSDVLNEVMDKAGTSAAQGGSSQLSGQSAQKLKAQAISIRDQLDAALQKVDAKVHVQFVYSYNYIWGEAKRRYADPRVYGYRGPFHRIIHRRYSRCRGIVHRIVSQKVSQAINSLLAQGRGALAQASTSNITMSMSESRNAGVTVGGTSTGTLYRGGTKIGQTVTYSQVKSLVPDIQRLSQAVENNDTVGTLSAGSAAAQKLGNAVEREACKCKHGGNHCMIFRTVRDEPGEEKALAWRQSSSCTRNICDELKRDANVALTCSSVDYDF